MALAIDVEGLQKRYGSHHALRGVNLAVPQGAVLGLLGPNGAGKTTTTRILATLSTPDGARYTDGLPDVDPVKRSLSVPVKASTETIALLSAALHYAGVEVQEFAVRRPSLNDVFFELTGHHVSAAVTS